MQKKHLVTAAALAIVGTTLFGATQAFAQTQAPEDPRASIVEKLATKFGLEESAVQAVFDEQRAEHQTEMLARQVERLTQLVSEGKITEEQKQLIIQKRQELMAEHQSEHESMRDKTPEERRAAMEEHRTALESWATEHGIDVQYLMPGQGQKGPGSMRGMMH